MINKADYIVSLVGKNPMPSFITVLNYLGYKPKIFLVHTEKSEKNIGTKKVAENIKKVLMEKNNQLTIELIECDKSNSKEIDDIVNSIIKSIKEDVLENKKDEGEIILLLDYSGGTKAMSAVFYERIINFKDNIIRTIVSYVDDKIIKLYSKSKDVKSLKIEDVFKGESFLIKDIVKLHGYKIKNNSIFNEKIIGKNIDYIEGTESAKITFENGNKKQEIQVNGAAFLPSRGSLVFCFDSKKKNYKDQKLELFKIKYYTSKLGGDKGIFLYRANFCKNNKDEDCESKVKCYKEDLENEIVRLYDYEMRDRCHLINKNMSFEETIKIISKL